MKHCVVYDSSFLIATIDTGDEFHRDAIYIFQKILEERAKIKIIIPTLVFYETIVTLIKKEAASREQIEKKLWNLLYSNIVLNVALIETAAFKTCKRLAGWDLSKLKTADFIISSVGLEYDAQILTFDKEIRKNLGTYYPSVYYCSPIGNMQDESERFLQDLYKAIGKEDVIDLDEIPF